MNPGEGTGRWRPFRIAALFVLIIIIGGALIASAVYLSARSSHAQQDESTEKIPPPPPIQNLTQADDPLMEAPGMPTLYHEDCQTPYPQGATECSVTTSTLGVPQVFNTSTVYPGSSGQAQSGTMDENLFGFRLDQNASIQFTFYSVRPSGSGDAFVLYRSNDTGVDLTTMKQDVESAASLNIVVVNGTQGQTADRFGGQIAAKPGVYIFDFAAQGLGSWGIYFIVRDATALQQGIKISVGRFSTATYGGGITLECNGKTEGPLGGGGPGEEEWPIEVSSNMTADVNLTTLNIPYGVWVKFVPSQLDVGPEGANATMILLGAGRSTGLGLYNSSLFIDAFGPGGGNLTGELMFPLDTYYGDVDVMHSAGPLTSTPYAQPLMFTNDQHQTNYETLSGVYDPPPGAANSSLSIAITGVGVLLANGTETRLPSWLSVNPSNSSFVMEAGEPFSLDLCLSIPGTGQFAQLTVALNEIVNGRQFVGEFAVSIEFISG